MTATLHSRLLSRAAPRHGWHAGTPPASGLPDGRVWRPRQVHGTTIVEVASEETEVSEADGALSATPGLGVGVVAADCVPLLLATEDGAAVSAVHVGWRGLAGGIVGRAVSALARHARSGRILAAAGPAASGCCYEVGSEVLDRLRGPRATSNAGGIHRHLDLRRLVLDRLIRAGIDSAEADRVGPCTICSRTWPSYRREGKGAGRLVAYVFPAGSGETV